MEGVLKMDWGRLKQYKDEILKAEIGALLFNLGKTHIGFWKGKGGRIYFNVDENGFANIFGFNLFTGYRDYYKSKNGLSPFEKEINDFNLKNFFKIKVKFPFKVNDSSTSNPYELDWIEFFKGDASEKEFIEKIFFRGCENINSGIDKGSPNKQLEPPLWLANAFGSFKEEINEKFFDEYRRKFFKNLYLCLKKTNLLNRNEDEIDWELIRNYIIKKLRKWYSHLLSDSRFPINDVTLFDQAYMTASMFKAVLAQLVLDSSKLEHYLKNPSSIRWRILGIQYDKLGLTDKSLKLRAISWYREVISEIDRIIKKYIEVKLVLGNEIYNDENSGKNREPLILTDFDETNELKIDFEEIESKKKMQ